MNYEERISWAISYVQKTHKLKFYQFAKKWGIDKATVAKYLKGEGIVQGQVLASLVNDYGFYGEWLICGKGAPFLGALDNYPEVCGSPGFTQKQYDQITESVHNYTKEAQIQCNPSADAFFKSDQKINIEEAMGKTYKVLSAGTALSVALYMNIQQFATALDTGQALQVCQDQMKAMQEQIDTLNAKVDRFTAHPSITEGQGDGSVKKAM